MTTLRLGIVGAGMIAGVIVEAVKRAVGVEVVAVASRRPDSAKKFAQEQGIPQVFDTWQEMLSSDEIDAVYVATPTSSKEEIALFGAKHKKHLLVDKPFASLASVQAMVDAAKANGVAFMDATHFTHNHRTQQLRETMTSEIGQPQALRSSFFFPFMDRTNIRFDTEKEPTGAVGDMTWYSMRAVAEFLQPTTPVKVMSGGIIRDEETNAVIRGTGVVMFEDGKSSTFDFGYNAGTCLMDLDILGHDAVFSLNDWVLDWKQGFAFDDPDHVIGYTKRTEMQTPKEHTYISADSDTPQAVAMMTHFAELAANPSSEQNTKAQDLAILTQSLLDAYWDAVK